MSHEGLGLFCLIWGFLLESWIFSNYHPSYILPDAGCSKRQAFCRKGGAHRVFFCKVCRLLVPQASSFRSQVTPSICFGLVPTRDFYKRAILNRLPTLIKCFNARFKLCAIAILLSLFNCSNWNSFCSVSPRVHVSVMCAEMGGEGTLDYWCLKSRETSRQILSSGCCFLKNTVTLEEHIFCDSSMLKSYPYGRSSCSFSHPPFPV